MGNKKGFALVLLVTVLAIFTGMRSASANEIWLTPSDIAPKHSSGNWPVFTSPWATFSFSVPDNMTAFESAKLVVIGRESTKLTYSLGLSIAGNGDPKNYYTDSAAGLDARLTKNHLQEIDISSYIPVGKNPGDFTIQPGDYVGMNFHFHPASAVNILGLRFQYEGPVGPQGPKGEKGEDGKPGKDGAPGATGPAGADGLTVLNGTSDPADGTGVDGDFYINTTSHTIFGPKTSGAWSSGTSLVGPPGTFNKYPVTSIRQCKGIERCSCPVSGQIINRYLIYCPPDDVSGLWARVQTGLYYLTLYQAKNSSDTSYLDAVCRYIEFSSGLYWGVGGSSNPIFVEIACY